MPPKITPAVRDALATLVGGPQPSNAFNPGVNRSMEKLNLVNTVGRPSPYQNSKGKLIEHQVINKNGMAALFQARNQDDTR
jgi:hypothetical protein